jgi:hypothetical protein
MEGFGLVQTISCANEAERSETLRLIAGDDSRDSSDDEARWVKVIDSLDSSENMRNSCFLYLREIVNQKGKAIEQSSTRGYLSAPAGTYYRAMIAQYCTKNTTLVTNGQRFTEALDTPIVIEMRTDHDHIKPLDEQYTFDGLYDICELAFKTETTAAGASTLFSITHTKAAPDPLTTDPLDPAVDVLSLMSVTDSAATSLQKPEPFSPTIMVGLAIKHARWQWTVLFIGVACLLGGFFLNTTPHVPALLKKAKEAQIITLIIAIGATLTTWLGKDFWATIFRRDIPLWNIVAAPVNRITAVLALCLLGWSLMGYLHGITLLFVQKGLRISYTVLNAWRTHTYTIGCVLLALGAILAFCFISGTNWPQRLLARITNLLG